MATDLGNAVSAATPPSLTITTLAGVSKGDASLLIHYANSFIGTISGVTDTAGNTYTNIVASTGVAPYLDWWIAKNANAENAGASITASFNSNALRHGIDAMDIRGVDPVNPVAAISPSASATGTTDGSVSVTLSAGKFLLVGVVVAGGALGVVTQPGGFTSVGGSAATAIILPAVDLVTGPGVFSYAPSWVNSVLTRIQLIALNVIPPSLARLVSPIRNQNVMPGFQAEPLWQDCVVFGAAGNANYTVPAGATFLMIKPDTDILINTNGGTAANGATVLNGSGVSYIPAFTGLAWSVPGGTILNIKALAAGNVNIEAWS